MMDAWPPRARSTAASIDSVSRPRPCRSTPPWCDSFTPMAGPTIDALTGSDLPLAANGAMGVDVEDRARAVEDDLRREDLAGVGLAHDPGRGVDRVAEDPVRAAVRRPEVAGEDLAGVHADPHRHEPVLLHDLAQGPEHPLLVVARARRRAGGQQGLDARLADVGLVEGDLVAQRGFLDRAHPLIEGVTERVRPDLLEQAVRVHHVDEGGRDGPVFRLALAQQDVRPCSHRDRRCDIEAVDAADVRGTLSLDLGRRAEQRDPVLLPDRCRPGRGAAPAPG